MKKIAVIGTVGIPACYGGFESLVENLTLYKSGGYKYYVFCSKKNYKYKLLSYNSAELIYLPLNANGIQSIFYDILSLIRCLFLKPDTVLILGISGGIFIPFFRLLSRSKIITNIDGLEWKRDKWNYWGKKFLKLSEYFSVKYSHVIVTDNQAIGDYVKEEYGASSVTIAYGGDHALRNIDSLPFCRMAEKYALGICRIEPENNVSMVLESFCLLNHKIKFVGNWMSSTYGRELKEKYSKYVNIELIDPIYDLDELYKLRSGCEIYIHGHSAGGTNPSLVEAMHFSVPVFAYDCIFNRYSTENKAHYFKNPSQLIELIRNTHHQELKNNADNMQVVALKRYTWKVISSSYESLY
ncbi:DUF1972 domain-containing protein [Pectobacterium quasiaquaticum]|uniref:DUF1972 domain-containing protein n=1 Tax=Pectobacterium quasiaquaticum TaxID=2774015 RepID=A0A9Q2ID38_9GAMM|nr:DUF1972 domain-containing protein [Pectobacterium quasiaquaticum]MBN3063860.1 DUF1972 domain-containing protein [Pectobacterium aquaticum]URG47839.1 DUF1972 domain-containing protein [Pectobacterium quasiaquaticum]